MKNLRIHSVQFLWKKYDCATPTTFFERIKLIAELGCVSYPMKFEPSTSLEKNCFTSPLWTDYQLKMIGKTRRILGYGGAFPTYEGLVKKFLKADSYEEAFSVYPLRKNIIKSNKILETKRQENFVPNKICPSQIT